MSIPTMNEDEFYPRLPGGVEVVGEHEFSDPHASITAQELGTIAVTQAMRRLRLYELVGEFGTRYGESN